MLLLYLFTLRLVSLFLSSSFLFSAMPNGGSDGEESACSVRDPGSILRLGRPPGGGHGNPLQYSCLENSMDRRAWQATIHGVKKVSDMTEWLHLIPVLNDTNIISHLKIL